MSKVNELLIQKVFQEMTNHKPSLSKYLMVDEDDPTDEIDVRVLGDLIIKNFPWPVGVELRRLFSGSMRELDRMRLDQLFKTIERTMQFVSFIMLAQLWEEHIKNKIEIQGDFSGQFKNRFHTLSLGSFTWMIRAIGKIFKQSEIEPFLPEMSQCLNNKFFEALDFWVPERNEIGHYQINLKPEEIERRCVEYEEKLCFILETLSFLCKYKLVTIREIKVLKSKHQKAKFNHVIDLLNSSDSDFKATELIHELFSDSNSVLVMKDIKTPTQFLNLSPLIIDTRTEIIDNKEKFNLKKDIFMYTKYVPEKIMFVGTEVTEKCDLTALGDYPLLLTQFKELLAAFSSNGEEN